MNSQANTTAPPPKRKPVAGRVSARLAETGRMEAAEALRMLETAPEGLTEAVAEERLAQTGPNEVASEKRHTWPTRLLHAVRNPLVILLTVLAIISFSTAQETSDFVGAWLMVLMVILGVGLRFIQESKADSAAAKLKAMIKVTATVVRDGQPAEVPLRCLVPGDIVKLSAGDMIPADVRILDRQGFVHHPGDADGRIVAGGKIRRARNARKHFAPGICQPLLSGHQRGKRHRPGAGRWRPARALIWAASPAA